MSETKVGNARYWTCVLYPEHMVKDWQENIGELLQLPYAYCIHNKDVLIELCDDPNHDERKEHVHIIIAFPNTTTYKNALSVFQRLDTKKVNYCEKCINIRYAYNYLLHDTETCKKKGKHLYEKNERIEGNDFDIGAFEQLSVTEKNKMLDEIEDMIYKEEYCNFMKFYKDVMKMGHEYRELVRGHSSHFKAIIQGFYQERRKYYAEKEM